MQHVNNHIVSDRVAAILGYTVQVRQSGQWRDYMIGLHNIHGAYAAAERALWHGITASADWRIITPAGNAIDLPTARQMINQPSQTM